jgi:hypothetical protein
MKSVQFVLKDCTLDEVDELFRQARYAGPFKDSSYRWLFPSKDDPSLYINIHTPDRFAELGCEEELREIVQVTGFTPTVFVDVDVSGRHSGRDEVHKVAGDLHSEFEGIGFDDYSSYDYFWTLDEILNGVRKEGFLFFDFLARYEDETKESDSSD